jgi:hypothetical protein
MAIHRKLRRYNLTLNEYISLLDIHDGKCAICGREDDLHVDHDHITGNVRGLLCRHCNTSLGWYEANADKIGAYL